jgi:hypothetical protein
MIRRGLRLTRVNSARVSLSRALVDLCVTLWFGIFQNIFVFLSVLAKNRNVSPSQQFGIDRPLLNNI